MKSGKLIIILTLFASFGLGGIPAKVQAQSAIGQLETLTGRKIDRYNGNSGNSNSNSNSSSYNAVRYERAATINSKGTEFFRNGNYKAAVVQFRKALWYSPFDENIKKNYQSAIEALKRDKQYAHSTYVAPKPKPTTVTPPPARPLPTAPTTPAGGRGRGEVSTTVPIMGGSPLTFEERERLRFIKLHGANRYDANASWNTISDGKIGKKIEDHPYIEVGRDIGLAVAGNAPGLAGYIGILAVNLWAEDFKMFKDIYDNKPYASWHTIIRNAYGRSAEDFINKGYGDIIGGQIYKGTREAGEIMLVNKGVSPGIAFISERPKEMAEYTKSVYDKIQLVKDGAPIGWKLVQLW